MAHDHAHDHAHSHGHDHDHAHAPSAPSADAGRPEISITERAAAKVKEIADAENLGGQGLRLRVIGGGCSGFSYDLYFEDSPTDMDEEFESRGVKLYVDPLSFQYLEGTEIDYVEELHASGFKFNNPKATGTCGCGSSFSA
jgi:iron-sulfur cluster insertion protein